ncbi:MAG: alpha/beta hydrolase [Actinobacteria bacterium]|nr:alpha/beta hydrolase [Actinomycetota bacterium]
MGSEAQTQLGHRWPLPRQRFVFSDGLRLSVLDWEGDRPPLLLLHGVGGNAWMWGGLARELGEHRRPLALDLRGYGDSQWSAGHDYLTDDHAGDVAALVAALELERLDLVGFSWGGLVALAFAAEHPELVERLVMVDISPSSELPEDAIPPNFRARFDSHADAVEGERALAPRAEEATLEALAALSTRAEAGGGLVRKMDPYLTGRWPFRSDDRWDQLRGLARPALVVRAAESPILSEDVAAAMAELPGVELVTIPGSGHLVANEQPRLLGRAIIDFLNGKKGEDD